jgi:hypothetical protein
MNIVKGGALGMFGGLLYAFVSFYLITDVFKKYIMAIASYGLQGFILGVIFVLLKTTYGKIKNKDNRILITNAIIGTISGFFSSGLGIIVTYHNTFARLSGHATDEIRTTIISRIIEYALGSSIIGLAAGFFIGLLLEQQARSSRTIE